MPDTMCRQCGGELDVYQKCFHCTDPIQLVCKQCIEPIEVKFHTQCVHDEEILCHTVSALA